MKITVGLGSIDNYIPYAKAGADEVFCGYVPHRYAAVLTGRPMNRREVRYVNVQAGSEMQMRILKKMEEAYQVPVTITLNAPFYSADDYPVLADYMQHCKSLGFSAFIIADPGLLFYLRDQRLFREFSIHISGELGEMNQAAAEGFLSLGARRIIFQRHTAISDMKTMIQNHNLDKSAKASSIKSEETSTIKPIEASTISDEAHPNFKNITPEWEAFALNEKCHFSGAWCNTLHCDELAHMCLVNYRLGRISENVSSGSPLMKAAACDNQASASGNTGSDERLSVEEADTAGLPGSSGCALCHLWQLRDAGITHLKLVSRGALCEDTCRDIITLKKALSILENAPSEDAFIKLMKETIFPDGCSHNCYYRPR